MVDLDGACGLHPRLAVNLHRQHRLGADLDVGTLAQALGRLPQAALDLPDVQRAVDADNLQQLVANVLVRVLLARLVAPQIGAAIHAANANAKRNGGCQCELDRVCVCVWVMFEKQDSA